MANHNPLSDLIDDLLHPGRKRDEEEADPGKPFTPPPSNPGRDEDDDEDGPSFPMDPVLA